MSVLKLFTTLSRCTRLQSQKHSIQLDFSRPLYSSQALGLDGFQRHKNTVKSHMGNIEPKFRAKMSEYVAENSKNIIFTEDLKNMVHIAESEDVDLVIKMMKRFNMQNSELRFGSFIFGPVVMRMFHLLNKPEEALQCMKLPEMEGFFDQMSSYQILFDLLYENMKYKELIEAYDLLKAKQIENLKWSRNILILVMATCFKLNTQLSLNYALKLWGDIMAAGHVPARKGATFCAALALKQEKPEICLEILSTLKNQTYVTVRNLKILAFIQLERIDDIVPMLKSVMSEEITQTFNKDVIEAARQYLEKENNPEILADFNQLMKYFKEHNNISENTWEQQLGTEINIVPRQDVRIERQPGNYRRTNNFRDRPKYNNKSSLETMD